MSHREPTKGVVFLGLSWASWGFIGIFRPSFGGLIMVYRRGNPRNGWCPFHFSRLRIPTKATRKSPASIHPSRRARGPQPRAGPGAQPAPGPAPASALGVRRRWGRRLKPTSRDAEFSGSRVSTMAHGEWCFVHIDSNHIMLFCS